MPDSKNPLIRYKILDQCLSNTGRNYTWLQLKETINEKLEEIYPEYKGISERQLREDLRYMKSVDGWDAPIITVPGIGKKKYYRYEDPNFTIQDRGLNTQQLEQLKNSLEALKAFRGIPQLEWLDEFLVKMESDYRFISDIDPVSKIEWDTNIDLVGREWLEPSMKAIHQGLKVSFVYTPFGKDPISIENTNPVYLKQYNKRWFLLTISEMDSPVFVNPLDRITGFQISTKPLDDGIAFDAESYFDDIVGVSHPRDQPIEEIVLRFTEERFPYVATKPIHPSQRNRITENEVVLKVKVNRELLQEIHAFGADCYVVKPIWLVGKFREEAQKLLAQYSRGED